MKKHFLTILVASIGLIACTEQNRIPETSLNQIGICPTYKHSFMTQDYGCSDDFLDLTNAQYKPYPKPYAPEVYASCVSSRVKADLDCQDKMNAFHDISEALRKHINLEARPAFNKLVKSLQGKVKPSQILGTAYLQFPNAFDRVVLPQILAAHKEMRIRASNIKEDLSMQKQILESHSIPQSTAPIPVISPASTRVAPAIKFPVVTNCNSFGNSFSCTTN